MSILIPSEDPQERRSRLYRDAARTAGLGLVANGLLMLLKLVGGIVMGSAALIADGVNSLGDVAGSLLVRGALAIAQQDADADHPYGHTKAESIAGLTVSVLIVFSALALGLETIRSWADSHAPVSVAAGVIGLLSAGLKEALYWYSIGQANRLHSSSLRAVAWDHRSDAISSFLIGTALLVGTVLGPQGWIVDRVAALIMCVVLIVVGLRLYRRTARELMDQQANTELVEDISAAAVAVQGVSGVEKLRVRKSGLEFFVEIHIEVDGAATVREGHRIGHEVKDRLMGAFPRIRDVHVHVEPEEGQPAEVPSNRD